MAQNENLTFLGSLPVDSELVTLLDAAEGSERTFDVGSGEEPNGDLAISTFPLLRRYLKTSSWTLFRQIVDKALDNLHRTEDSGSPL